MIGRLIDRFRAAGLDPSAEEVLDALWLASRFVAPPETAAPRGAEAPLRTAPIPDLHAGSGAEPAALPGPRRPAGESALADVQVRSAPQHRPHSTAQSDGAVVASAPARARRTPPAEAFDSPRLPTAPELSRALRPMRRQVDSRSRVVVDEGATAARLADALLVAARAASAGTANDALDMSRCQPLPVMPVLRPAKDRRPGLIIVSDTSRTMVLWRERVAGFARLLQSAGGMGAATWHEMDTEAPGGALALRRTGSRGGERSPIPAVRWVATQLSPDGIRAVIFLTDAVSEGFRRKDVEQWLSSVARRAPLAIVQVLPPWFWARTGLRAFEGVQVRTGSAGRSNTGLSVDPPPLARDPRERGAPVPILSTDAPDLAAWARIVTGMTGDRLHAVRVVAPARATEPGGRRATTTALAWATRSASKPPHTPDPDALLRSFRDGCSATALRIATLAAAAPLTLPLLVFLAQTMVPGARRHHLAEVLLGGLLREAVADVRSAREDELHYEFHEGVRERLLGRLTAGEAQEVLRRAGTCMESRLGLGFGFHTLLPFHRGARRRALDDRATSFTLVAERVLRRMGVDLSDWDERRLRVFLSFADDDADMAVELERHLTPQVRVGRVSVWHKGRVPLGEDRTVARDRHLREADLFLVLLSGHYMKSPETRAELQLLRAEFGNRNAQVLQIPVRPLGRGNPLSRLPTLETQPISTLLDRDSAWLRVALEVERTALHNARVHAPIRVFVSAAEEDEAFVSLLERHLALPNLSAEMEISHRGLVPAGDDKKAYIERRLGEAQMILVLVSADYLHEDALYRRELSAALARTAGGEAILIPIQVRPAALEGSLFDDLKSLPANGTPISRWPDAESAMADVAANIEDVIDRFRRRDGWERASKWSRAAARSAPGDSMPVTILATRSAERHRSQLTRHLGVLRQHGFIQLASGPATPLTGKAPRSISLLLCDRELGSAPDLISAARRAREAGDRVIPILVEAPPARIPPELEHLYALPRGGIESWEDADEAWKSVSEDIAGVVREMLDGPASRATTPPLVFDCYAWEDARAHERLSLHLVPLIRHGALRTFAVNRAGESLSGGLRDANVVVLLLSRSFLDSRFCMQQAALAVERHRARQALCVVVLLQDVDVPVELSDLQPIPRNRMPVDFWSTEDEAWSQVVSELVEITRRAPRSDPPGPRGQGK